MTLLTTLQLNFDPTVVCPPTVARLDEPLGGIFGQGVRLVDVLGVLIPPLLNQTIASQEEDPDIELVYYLLQRACGVFDPSIVDGILGPIRAKVLQTQDLSLLTEDERTMVRTLNRLYNTDFDSSVSVYPQFPESGLIT
jgi:hypothetical protein